MSTRKLILALGLACTLGAGGAVAQTPGLGKTISEADIAAWNIDVLPDGTGLPAGSGTAVRRFSMPSSATFTFGSAGLVPGFGDSFFASSGASA